MLTEVLIMQVSVKLCFFTCRLCKEAGTLHGSVNWCVLMGCRCIYLPMGD